MKRKMIQGKTPLALVAVCLCLGAGRVYGDDPYEEIDGIKWYYSVSNEEATVTSIWSSRDGNSPSGDLNVPGTLGEAPVARIARYTICPYGNSGLGSVTFPDSLRTMDEGNFMRCSALTNVVFGTGLESFDSCFSECWNISAFVVPEGNPNFSAEGPVLYSKDKKTLVKCCAQFEEFEVPSSVEVIGPSAFAEMGSLKRVTFSSGLLEIQDRAFYNCTNLASVLLPSGLQVIGSSAFSECHAITSMAIPASVAKIGDNAFARNISLVSLTIAEGVKDVGWFSFGNCDMLPAVTIPNSVTNIGGGAFEYCTNLWDVTIGSGVVKIGEGLGDPWVDEWGYVNRDSVQPAFGGCDSLMNFRLADGNKVFEEIGGCLFLRDTPKAAKTLAVYPSGREDLYFTGDVNVTKIGEGSCAQCNKFTTIDITNSVRDVAAQSFMSCWKLCKVVVNPGVTNIDYGAFMLNMQLADVEIAGTVKTIGEQAFMHCYMPDDEVIGRLVLHEGIEEIGPRAFEITRDLVEVVIPDSVTKIGYGAFSDVMRLKRLTVGSGVTELPPYFCGSEVLKSVTIRGENLKRLGEGAFAYCRSFETINLPASVEFIGEYAFDQCEKLPYISIPASVIDPNAFAYCEELARVDFTDDLRAIGTNAFLCCYDLNNVVIPESVETIEPGAFEKCWSLGTVYLPEKFEGVLDESSVFAGCPLDGEGIVYYGPEGVAYVTVTFMSQGKPVETRKYLANTLDYLPAITADGLAFVGWYNAEEGGTPASDADLSGDVTFYARWVESPFINTGVQEWNPAEDEAFPGAIVWRTGDLTGGEEASASYAVVGPAVVSFSWKWSGSSDDYLTVYVDGEEAGFTQSADWTKATVQVPEFGSHVMTWTYSRYRWSSDPETAYAGLADIRVTAGTAKTITFDTNGGTLDEDWEATRKVVTILGDLPFADKDGVAFAGWWTERDGGERVTAATKPEGDATYYAHWVELPFKVSGSGKFWVAEDGSWATLRSDDDSSVTASITLTGPCMVSFDWRHAADRWSTSLFRVDGNTKYWREKDEGWETVTWSADDTEEHVIEWEFSGGWSYDPGQMFLKNISMGTPCEIAFDPVDYGASIYMSDVDRIEAGIFYVKRGETLGHLPIPYSRRYLAFDGWYTAAEGGEKVTSETPVTGPATYYAHWVESPVTTFNLRSWLFESDGSLGSDNNCNKYNSSIVEKHLEGPGTLTFRWRMQSDSGNGYFSFLVEHPGMTSYAETNRLTKSSGEWTTERYVFTSEESTGIRWAYGVEGDRGGIERGWIKDVKWVSNVVDTVEWTVTFDANGGELEGDAEKVVTDEFPVGKTPVATRADYSFLGWFTEAEGGEEVTEETPVSGDATYYAHWAPLNVGLTFVDDAGVAWHYQIKGDSGTSEFYVEIVGDGTYPVSGGQIVETGAINKGTAGALAIPSHINGCPVRVIGTWAFAYCRQLTEVTIPDTVTIIRDGAFASCSNMKKVNFGANVQTVGKGAFLYCISLNFVELPKGAELGASAFGGCESLRYLKATGNFSSGSHIAMGDWIGGMMLNLVQNGVDQDPLWDCTAISCIELGEEVTSVKLDGFGKGPNLRNIICRGSLPSFEGGNTSNGKTVCHVLRANYPDGLPSDTWAGMQLKYLEGEVPTDSVAVDFEVRSAALSNGGSGVDSGNTFSVDDEILFSYESIERWCAVGIETQIVNRIVVKHLPDGGEIGRYDDVLENCSGNVAREGLSIPALANLKSGKYELCLELNVNRDVAETYYGNNTTSITFTVGSSEPPEPVDPFTAAGLAPSYVLQAGAAPDLSKVFAAVAGDGWKIAVSGLPAGLKFAQDRKTGDYSLTGVATKEVASEVTFTATKGKDKETAKSTFEVVFPTLSVVAVPAKDDPSATNGVKVAGGGKYALGTKVTLKATPAKTSVFVGWFLGEELVSQSASYAYVTTAEDVTFTAKFVTADEDRENVSLAVDGAAVGSVEAPTATNVMCGVALEWPVAAGALSATTVKVAGLPAGLKFTDKPVMAKVGTGKDAVVVTNVPANTIYGAPSAASKTATDRKTGAVTVTPSDVKITVTTAGKSSVTYLVKLTVDPLPAWAVGNFEGVAGDGSATMSVAASGKVSGKIALNGTNWTFKADSFAKESETVGATNFVLNLSAASGKASCALALTLSALPTEDLPTSATALADGTFGEGTAQLWRLPWADKGDADAAKLAATLAGAYSCSAAYGSGSCDVTFTLDEKGAVKGSLVAPDGSKTRKATFSANALPKADGIYAAIVLAPDAKKGYPAVCEVVELIGQAGVPEKGVAYRDPGVVAAVAERTPGSGASGTVTVSPKYGQVAAGKDVSLTAKPSDKHSVFYRWEITGLDTEGLDLSAATLKFKSPGTNDVVVTAVFVKDTEDADSVELAVAGADLKDAVPTWSNYCGVAVNWDVEATALSATTVKAAGLPAGLKLVQDKKTKAYTVEGVPTAASKAAKGSTELAPSPVKFTVTTAGKSSKDFTVNLVVLPLPVWAAGTFDGAAYAPGGEPVEGVVQALTIDAKGKIGGKILKNGETWALCANSFESVDGLDDPENLAFYATLIGKNGKLLETNSVTVSAAGVEGVTFALPASSWSAYQNLWKRADTKGEQPVFKASFDRTVELGTEGDLDNTVKLTFKKDGVIAFAGKVGGTKVSGSSQLVNDGMGWAVTLYAPAKAPFDGWCEMFAVTLKTDEKNVVTDVTVETAAAEPPPAWGVGEYIGYGYVEYPPATLGGISEEIWGLVYMDMNDDFSFTGRFLPVLGSPAPFSGKMYRIPEMSSYLADDVAINVNGDDALLHFQFITMGFGKMSGQSSQCSPNITGVDFFNIVHNVWASDDFPEARPTFASGATKSLDLKDHPGLYSQAGKTYTDGDALTFVFGDGGKVAVTGQIFGVAVNSTATLGVGDIIEDGAKFDCSATFEANGRIYQLMIEIPSSGTVTSDDIVLPGDPDGYFGIING